MPSLPSRIDRLQAPFDHDGLVANTELLVPTTLMARLGLKSRSLNWGLEDRQFAVSSGVGSRAH